MSLSSGYFKKGMTMRAVWTLLLTAVLWISAPLQAAENVTYYHNDALGSPVAATDADGNLLWREIYEPFGRRFEQDPSSDGNSRWYTGHQETDYGLVYMGARHYDPVLGRFLSVDPVRFVEDNHFSFNRYAYVNNNPYRYIDPDGRSFCSMYFTGAPTRAPSRGCGGGGTGVSWGLGAAAGTLALGYDGSQVQLNEEDPQQESADRLKDVTGGTTPENRKGTVVAKPDGDRDADFDRLTEGSDVVVKGQEYKDQKGTVKIGEMPDGRRVISRDFSRDGRATIEIQSPRGRTRKEIRYGQSPDG